MPARTESDSLLLHKMNDEVDIVQEVNPGDTPPSRAGKFMAFLKTKRCRQELMRTAMAVAVFLLTTCAMMVAQISSDEWFDNYSKTRAIIQSEATQPVGLQRVFAIDPLHDRIFEWIPDWQHLRGSLPDALLSAYILSFLLFNVVWINRQRIQFQGLVVVRRFLWIMSCLYFFRMATFMVTTVPNPVHNCVPKYADASSNFEQYVRLIKEMASGKVSACTDNIYSGHTTMTMIILFFFWMYSGQLFLQIYALLHAQLIIGAILITRLHYTIDVLIAVFMSAFVFLTFHFLLAVVLDDKLLAMSQIVASKREAEILRNERVTLHRVYKRWLNRTVWWLDGFDLRLASAKAMDRRDQVGGLTAVDILSPTSSSSSDSLGV